MIRRPPRSTHSFPTRRSSDLGGFPAGLAEKRGTWARGRGAWSWVWCLLRLNGGAVSVGPLGGRPAASRAGLKSRPRACKSQKKTAAHVHGALVMRSEEQTSELQSLMRISYRVFCLKKKTKR